MCRSSLRSSVRIFTRRLSTAPGVLITLWRCTGMSDEPNWVQVLEVMYEEGDFQTLKSLNENYDFDIRMTKAQSSGEFNEDFEPGMQAGIILINTIQNLEKVGLIKRFGEEDETEGEGFVPESRFILTDKGFQIAHDRKMQRREQDILNQTNKAYWIIGGLTVVLALGEAINAAVALGWV